MKFLASGRCKDAELLQEARAGASEREPAPFDIKVAPPSAERSLGTYIQKLTEHIFVCMLLFRGVDWYTSGE